MLASARRHKLFTALGIVFFVLLAFVMSANPVSADPGNGNGGSNGKAVGNPHTEDTDDDGVPNNIPDEGDNQHPSGKDRSVENGNSGNQGNAQADPDGDTNGGVDQPGGTGGDDVIDQDGNNGCGNDDDFEDDNNGNCGGNKPTTPPDEPTCEDVPKPDGCEEPPTCKDDPTMEGCEEPPTCKDDPTMDGCEEPPTCKDDPTMEGCTPADLGPPGLQITRGSLPVTGLDAPVLVGLALSLLFAGIILALFSSDRTNRKYRNIPESI